MFRRGSKPAQPAADAERQALFEKLAQRPESVCPFLGLAAARAEFEPQATDEHRCYAFGDPEPLSGEQQRNVCLQLGYANCPRYLRGVLVIPTDELEALRRPPQRIPPPPPPPPTAPQPDRDRRRILAAVLVLLLLVGGGVGVWYMLAGPGAVAVEPSPTPERSVAPTPSVAPSTTPTPEATAAGPTSITGASSFTLSGAATRIDDVLRMTPSTFNQVSAAWFPTLVPVADGFHVAGTVTFSGELEGGGDGIALVVQTVGPDVIGSSGGELGYGGLAASVAVEFDTFLNTWPGVSDPNANHVSVQTARGGVNAADHALSLGVATEIANLSDGQPHRFLITYASSTLSVAIDGVEVLSVPVDLVDVLPLRDGGTAYIGFTASTGDSAQVADVADITITFP